MTDHELNDFLTTQEIALVIESLCRHPPTDQTEPGAYEADVLLACNEVNSWKIHATLLNMFRDGHIDVRMENGEVVIQLMRNTEEIRQHVS